jgi:uncharacterized protein YydD (DUF2326 family)
LLNKAAMIKEISSNNPKFKNIKFEQGFNVILADRSNTSSNKDSRNGLGKSSLVNVIHFLLGSNPGKDKGLRRPMLSKWTYSMVIVLDDKEYVVERSPEKFSEVYLAGDFSDWLIQPKIDKTGKRFFLKNSEWSSLLGNKMFGLPIDQNEKYYPSFRGLISFFIREGSDAYNDPFQHLAKQLEWDKQVQNAYLLKLNYEYPILLQDLKDKEEALNQLKKASEQGLLGEFVGTIGDLEAERVRLTDSVSKLNLSLKDFKVHPEYREIQNEANLITKQIQEFLNERNINEQLLSNYKSSLNEEKDVSADLVQRIYNEAGVVFPDRLIRSIEEINQFHILIIKNRHDYLNSEINRLERELNTYDASISALSFKRVDLLEILQTHGALEEHFKLQQRFIEKKQLLDAVVTKIANLQKIQEGKSDLKIEKEDLLKRMRRDYQERKTIIDQAIAVFNKNSEFLYDEPGNLVIDVKDTGYKFRIDIKRSGSNGIDKMKVLCYDLSLAQLRIVNKSLMPDFLIHDSSIFDGVDERQVAKALERTYLLSKELQFQYICTLNSDAIPYNDFSPPFKDVFDGSVRFIFDDSSEEGGLFGFRF